MVFNMIDSAIKYNCAVRSYLIRGGFMIDLHSHILFDLDDGPKTKEVTMEMLSIAVHEGIHTIIATPHYIDHFSSYEQSELYERFKDVQHLIRKESIPLNLYLGNEIRYYKDLLADLTSGKFSFLASSSYLLIELPFTGPLPLNLMEDFFRIIQLGYRPIIAHIERCEALMHDLSILDELVEIGCLTQLNSSSLTTTRRNLQKKALQLVSTNRVHFIASDCHSSGKRGPYLTDAYKIVCDHVSKEKAHLLFEEHATLLISDEHIPSYPIIKKRKRDYLWKPWTFMKTKLT